VSHTPFRIARVNTSAIASNVRHLREITGVADVLVAVKANGFGHGMVQVAQAALAGGATWLGVADIDEALALRAAGIAAPILCWLHAPDETFDEAIEQHITVGVCSLAQLRAVVAAGQRAGRVPAVHIKVDTGLSRNGVNAQELSQVLLEASEAERAGTLLVQGIFSHLSNTSVADNDAQRERFDEVLEQAASTGLTPAHVHLAASWAALTQPSTRYSMVRIGIAAYGISPVEDQRPEDFGLVPALTLESRVAAVRRVPAGAGVSYGYLHRTSEESTLALVPMGYGEGLPRAGSELAPVVINGRRYAVAGRLAMDQFVVDLGQDPVAVGDRVVLFGDPAQGHPSVHEWAAAAGTIGYEIVTQLGGSRLTYVYEDSE
jgi:alanine racemase